MKDKQFSKESLKRQKVDIERGLRVVKYIDYPFVLPDSPIELEEGYIVSDRQTCDVFASFIFKNVSERPVKEVKVRLACYYNQNIPYLNIDFTYSQKELTFGIISKNGVDMKLRDSNNKSTIDKSETFGSCVFIPIPESYFTKMDVILLSVQYCDGETEQLNTLVAGDAGRYRELDDISKMVYSRVNIYQSAEERYPTVVIPQFGNKVWLCCCGNKNPSDRDVCEKCGREKEWQKNTVSRVALEETKQRIINDPREVTFHDKSKFKQNKYLENKDDIQHKIEQYEKAIKNVALEEQRKHRRQMMLIPKILIAALIMMLVAFGLRVIIEFQTPVQTEEGAGETGNADLQALKDATN